MQIAEEQSHRPDQRRLRPRRQELSVAGAHPVCVQRLGQLPDLQTFDGCDPSCGELAIPALGIGAIRVLGVQPPAGFDQRVVGMPAGAERQRRCLKPPARPRQPDRRDVDLAGLAAIEPLRPRGLRGERHPAEQPHVRQRAGELLNAVAARVVGFLRAQPCEQLALLAKVLEQRAAGEQHQLIERALHVRALQHRRGPKSVEVVLHTAERPIDGVGPEHAAGQQPRPPAAEEAVQIPLITEQVGHRGDRRAVVGVRAADGVQPLLTVPAPERSPCARNKNEVRARSCCCLDDEMATSSVGGLPMWIPASVWPPLVRKLCVHGICDGPWPPGRRMARRRRRVRWWMLIGRRRLLLSFSR
jgi:hypothetical protein